MLRLTRRVLSASAGTFSSAAFTGDDATYTRLQQERERLACDFTDNAAGATSSRTTSTHDAGAGLGSGVFTSTEGPTFAERPTIETYRSMSDEDLIAVFKLRDQQVRQLRTIYSTFHYDADKCFRKMVFDYHDKALQLSQVHGQMQAASLQISREALSKMREEQEMLNRDKRLIIAICIVMVVVFWVWVRRHYVTRKELEEATTVLYSGKATPVLGAGGYGENIFGSEKRNARVRETSWEREVRERREARAMEASNRKLSELEQELGTVSKGSPASASK